jgi:hypothetical protein
VKIEVHGRTDQLRYRQLPLPRHGQAELFRAAYGPTVRAFESLDEDGRAALAADLAAHWTTGRAGHLHLVPRAK